MDRLEALSVFMEAVRHFCEETGYDCLSDTNDNVEASVVVRGSFLSILMEKVFTDLDPEQEWTDMPGLDTQHYVPYTSSFKEARTLFLSAYPSYAPAFNAI